MKTRRSAVFVIPNATVGHELVFRHHTNKVVVGNYTYSKTKKDLESSKPMTGKKKRVP